METNEADKMFVDVPSPHLCHMLPLFRTMFCVCSGFGNLCGPVLARATTGRKRWARCRHTSPVESYRSDCRDTKGISP